MTLGIVLFRTEYRSCLKYPVEHTYHHLLVELWTLLQNRRPMKIFQLEQIRPAFRDIREQNAVLNTRTQENLAGAALTLTVDGNGYRVDEGALSATNPG